MVFGEKYELVSVNDAGLQTERATENAIAEYVLTRDIALARPYFDPVQPPTIFTMRELPHDLWGSYIEYASNDEDAYRRCFLAGVVKIRNLYQSDGTFLPEFDPPREKGRDIASEEIFRRISPSERIEIGSVVWLHSFLPFRTRRVFRLPRTCHAQFVDRRFLPADANPSLPVSSSAEASPAVSPQSAPTAHEPVSIDASCVSPTDATAAATPSAAAVG
jgi:hypothetical protein